MFAVDSCWRDESHRVFTRIFCFESPMLISVTRLHIRKWRFIFGFFQHTLRSRRQIQSSAGFVRGFFAREGWRGFWTVTLWQDELSMKAFRNSGAHLRAMTTLSGWCDEASYVHWGQSDVTMPTVNTIFERLRDQGNLSRVSYPSPAHQGGRRTGAFPPVVAGEFHPKYILR